MKGLRPRDLRFRPGELRRSDVPQTNLLPGAGQPARAERQERQARRRAWLLLGLGLCLLALLGVSLF